MAMQLGLVGLGKIARAQHLPAIAATDGIELAAVASRNASLPGLPSYPDVDALLTAEPGLGAISLCTPPQGRFDQAAAAIAAGRHVMLEKPPGATVSEVAALAALAADRGVTLFATWHSREAAAVDAARDFIAGTRVRRMRATWKEDVRRWHPGQQWIWEPGGLGVFDPGINALSILTRLMPGALRLTSAELYYPANRASPIAATLSLGTAEGVAIAADFDWRQTGRQTWEIAAETDAGALLLSDGGSRLTIAGRVVRADPDREYERLYHRFAALISAGQSDVDVSPLMLVADAFLVGRHHVVEAFDDEA